MAKTLETNFFIVNKNDNSGEQLSVLTEFLANGDVGGVFMIQKIALESYCNSASFELRGAVFTPEKLRDLADQLEACLEKAKAKTT